MKKLLSVSLCFTFLASSAFANPLEYYFQQKMHPQTLNKEIAAGIQENYFDQLIDHHGKINGTFKQRYYLDESYAQSAKSPVFLMICGEYECEKKSLDGSIRTLAQKYHARLIAVEHRYYGKSWPTKTASTTDLQYLTTDNALKDLDTFQTAMMQQHGWQGKWVAFGGSYPGSLSAYYRETYPQNVVGALASSAPVKAQEFFPEYDAHVAKVAGPDCAENLRIAIREVEAAINNPVRMAEIKKMFNAEKIVNDLDFLNLLADVTGAAVQYGMQGKMCFILAHSKTPLDGLAYGTNYALSLLGIDAVTASIQGAMSEEISAKGLGFRQWAYQSCAEYGYWQIANSDPKQSTRSALLNEEYERGICKRLFGIETKANTDYINNKYYFPLLNNSTSNIYFTNGANDPWSNLSLAPQNGNATNPNLTYYTIKDAAHCEDIHAPSMFDSSALKEARNKMDALITGWLRQ